MPAIVIPSYGSMHNQILQPLPGYKKGILIKGQTFFKMEIPFQPGVFLLKTIEQDITDITNAEAILDTGLSLEPGKDYFLYAVLNPDFQDIHWVLSLNTTAPLGATTQNSRKIGGAHTLCAAVEAGKVYTFGGQTFDHELAAYPSAVFLPRSFWDLKHRPSQLGSPQRGLTYERRLNFWPMIYGASGTGLSTVSAYQGTLSRNREYVELANDLYAVGIVPMNEAEYTMAALGCPEQVAVLGASEAGATAGGAGGRVATNNARITSDCGCEEPVGCLWYITSENGVGGMVGAIYGRTGGTDVSPTMGTITMTTSSHGPYPQSGGKGQFWGLAGLGRAGGGWNYGSSCGSRARSATDARSYAYSCNGGRGRARGAA